MLQAMVAGLFGCLLLLAGTCSAWHDSHHGERRAFSEPLPFHHSTYWTSFADLAPEWPDYLDSFKAELRHPRSSSRFSFLRGFHLFNKSSYFSSREEPGLQFPPLSARQKQFALNPGHPEYYRLDCQPIFFKLEMIISRERPDFLQFGLQALDDSSDPRQEAAREAEKEVGILF